MSYNPYAYAPDNGQPVTDRFAQHPQAQQQTNELPKQPSPGNNFKLHDPRNTMAFQLGQSAFSNFIGQENFNQFQETVMNRANTSMISHYFQVSTSYVLTKMKLILIPFLNKNNWARIMNGNGSFLTPVEDANSPDLYIPIMGLITYILIWNIKEGLNGSFNPENLYYKLSSTLAFVTLDLIILKIGLYLLVNTNSPVTSILELTCYVGYKFIPLSIVLLCPVDPKWVVLIAKMYLFISLGVFLLRSIKFNLFIGDNNDINTVSKSVVKKCNYFLFVYGFFWQSILMWLMG
ncbi:hypothetical protein KAFR_0D03900 [Kazachstania africana CBS 2517]|uniref:Protein YIF1 n=1 Tax=Kazachstania africana (strain ATCC 22294 / BCRC 22015 / CBS 2517 / CECT 1963 / NBRC 1671 / NRRL Y-8276) TaxID=1071382 RepID=H2AUI8_KAZAF|nr:hypothetical protein KAFR_0D03900 [Kazachstania africana CBS 2517]CCF58038.1 hypothetical protein KAFR_0D03900 [Kazachstania africana CBS 2517]